MLLDKHECYNVLFDMRDNYGINIDKELSQLMSNSYDDNFIIPKSVITHLKGNKSNYVIEFYMRLNNKAHKLIKQTLTCLNQPISVYIKIATSIITQSIITLEHDFKNDIVGQNKFIQCLQLADLSNGLADYFTNGDTTLLVSTVNSIRLDIKLILDTDTNDTNIDNIYGDSSDTNTNDNNIDIDIN